MLRILGHDITAATGVLVALLLIFGSQFTLFAMWFDMESNKDHQVGRVPEPLQVMSRRGLQPCCNPGRARMSLLVSIRGRIR